jgi:hypothetical protein
MLTRIRIEVSDEESAATAEMTLDKYEAELMAFEAGRRDLSFANMDWEDIDGLRALLGREVTDEVIEFDSSLPGYKGRRVVQFRRIDTRSANLAPVESTEASSSTSLNFAVPGKTAA